MGGGLVLVPRRNMSRLEYYDTLLVTYSQRGGQAQGPLIHSAPPLVPTEFSRPFISTAYLVMLRCAQHDRQRNQTSWESKSTSSSRNNRNRIQHFLSQFYIALYANHRPRLFPINPFCK